MKMSFEDFKDEVISIMRSNDVVKNIIKGNSFYAQAGKDRKLISGGLGDQLDLVDNCNKLKESARAYDYTAVSVCSMVAELGSKDEAEELYNIVSKLNERDVVKFLEDRNLVSMSISIRFEQRTKEENSLVTFEVIEEKLAKHIEMFDTDVDDGQISAPFGGDIYEN